MINENILKLLSLDYHDLASITIFSDGSGYINDNSKAHDFDAHPYCFSFETIAELEAHLTQRSLDASLVGVPEK